jgi:hypothetical protein
MSKISFEFTRTFSTQVTCIIDIDEDNEEVLSTLRLLQKNPQQLDLSNFKNCDLVTVDGDWIDTLPGVTIEFTEVEDPNDEEFFCQEYSYDDENP